MPARRGLVLVWIAGMVLSALVLGFLHITIADKAEGQEELAHQGSVTASYSIANIVVNGGNAIIPIVNATQTVTVNFTLYDTVNGCGKVFSGGNVTTTLYRSGVVANCGVQNPSVSAKDLLNCYVRSTTTHNCVVTSSQSANATTTFDVWYFAEATDASSSYPSEEWHAFVATRNASSVVATGTVATAAEMSTMLGISLQSSTLNYGTLAPSSTTGSTTQASTVKNAGNASTSLSINGTALCSGGNCMPTSSIHYATSTFTYGEGEQALAEAATVVSGWFAQGKPLGAWTETTRLGKSRFGPQAVAYNGFMYSVGGGDTSSVLFAPINTTGSLGAWSSTTALPLKRDQHASVAHNGYIYALSGFDEGGLTVSVLYAPINATGSIGTWASTTPLPNANYLISARVWNNFIYFIGQFGSSINGYYAPIYSTGSLGAWTAINGDDLFGNHFAALWDGYLYAVGTKNGTSTSYFAPINATGSVGPWASTTPHPDATITEFGFTASNGFVYTVKGTNSGKNYYAPALGAGGLGPWSEASIISGNGNSNAAAAWNGYLYSMGGYYDVDGRSFFAPLPSRDLYFGLGIPSSTLAGTYQSTVTYTAVFSP